MKLNIMNQVNYYRLLRGEPLFYGQKEYGSLKEAMKGATNGSTRKISPTEGDNNKEEEEKAG